MEQISEILAQSSPHLDGVFRRLQKYSPQELELLKTAYQTAILNHGAVEPDFSRDPGVSFNPRPARISLILINTVDISDLQSICAGMLACIPNLDSVDKLPQRLSDAAAIAQASQLPATAIKLPEALIINAALFLDRARQSHRSSKQELPTLLLEESKQILELITPLSSPLAALIQAWQQRTRLRQSQS
ncbi:hypothetical protein JNK13_01230 [bacterium]|nr:hypothetical protein [bacterium]